MAETNTASDRSLNVFQTTGITGANLISFLLNLGVVAATQRGLFGGKDNAQISDEHPTLVTPAGWAFSIWGVIFTSELAFVMWQSLTAGGQSDLVKKGVGPWFAIACLFQAAWSVAFAQEQLALSAALLVVIATSLGVAVIGLAPYKTNLLASVQSLEFWVVHFPIGLHAGWTCAAALVNISLALEGSPDSTKVTALILTLVLSCLAGCFAVAFYHDQAYLCAIAWALAGISSKVDFRSGVLSADVADGVTQALKYSWVGLLLIGASTAALSMVKK